MSVARGLGQNGGHFYSNITQPVNVDVQFTVTPTNGLGITSLKSNGYVRNVFMHTSTTPTSNDGALNPNPPDGYALVQLNNNFNKFLGAFLTTQAPNGAGQMASTTANTVYVIGSPGTAKGYVFTVTSASATQGATYTNNTQTFTVLETISSSTTLVMSGTGDPLASGTLTKTGGSGDSTIAFSAFTGGTATTTAQWQAVGLPAGLTPTAGQSFVATASQAIGGSGYVVTPSNSGIQNLEIIGDPNTMLANTSLAANGGAYLMIVLEQSDSPTAPNAGTVIDLRLSFDRSTVTIDGL